MPGVSLRWPVAAVAVTLLSVVLFLTLAGSKEWAGPNPSQWNAIDSLPEAEGDGAALDLREMNEAAAGDNGFIGVSDGRFVHLGTGAPIRFWGVNGPPRGMSGDALRDCARMLARRGVNLVRIHAEYVDDQGVLDDSKVSQAMEVVEALKAEGIYSFFSIYYPLWLTPAPDNPWLRGYDGNQHPFAALMFNSEFQEQYRRWWSALLLTKSPRSGRALVDEPAVAGIEIQNEDSLLFPTLHSLPEEQLRILEALFGRWLRDRYGSLEGAVSEWNSVPLPRDAIGDGRVSLRPLWQVVKEKTSRDRDTVRFLVDTEVRFYTETYAFLRSIGFQGVIGTSNWHTADDRVLGPLEKFVATRGDFVDRHGYFGSGREGEAAGWSLRPGQTFVDRSALRFDDESGTAGRDFENPVMDPRYAGKPSMLSEVSWERPNRFRAEASLFLAAYGALQATDAIVQFRVEDRRWTTRYRDVATPWPLNSPGQLGQFPAAALIFRNGLVSHGEVVAGVSLGHQSLNELRGTPLPQGVSLAESDHVRVLGDGLLSTDERVDPLIHFTGRVEVEFSEGRTASSAKVVPGIIDPIHKVVRSTTGELDLDYGAGLLVIDASQAQGAVGALSSREFVETSQLRLSSSMETGTIVAVALDGLPLQQSTRILLQVMSEEQATGFQAEQTRSGRRRIVEPGGDPWQVREIRGFVAFRRPDAERLRVTALDLAGRRLRTAGNGVRIELLPTTLHYLIEK